MFWLKTGALQVLIAKVVAKFGNKEAIFHPASAPGFSLPLLLHSL